MLGAIAEERDGAVGLVPRAVPVDVPEPLTDLGPDIDPLAVHVCTSAASRNTRTLVLLLVSLDPIDHAEPRSVACPRPVKDRRQWGDVLPEHALLDLIEAFHTLDLSPSLVGHDVRGNAYEYLLKQFADEPSKKAGGRYQRYQLQTGSLYD